MQNRRKNNGKTAHEVQSKFLLYKKKTALPIQECH